MDGAERFATGFGAGDHPNAGWISLDCDTGRLGSITFNIWMREDSVVIDKFLLTTDAAFVISPNTAVGPAESPREGAAPPMLTISRAGGDVVLTWDNPNAVLKAADEITGSWTLVTGATSGYRVAAGGARRFYRAVVR